MQMHKGKEEGSVLLIRKDTATQAFAVSTINSNHGKWKLSKKFVKCPYSLEITKNSSIIQSRSTNINWLSVVCQTLCWVRGTPI